MTLLAFKLVVAPLLLLAASLAIRRWGEAVGGLVVGLPLTSGPVSVFLALEQGPAFAAQATSGSLVATAAQAAFGLAYCTLAGKGWPAAFAAGGAAFLVVAVPLGHAEMPPAPLFIVALASIAVSLRFSPQRKAAKVRSTSPWWDLPARIALMVGLIVGVTLVAPFVGPEAAGVLASFPVMGIILAVFAHRNAGPAAAQEVMRGMVAGLVGFGVFFFVLGVGLVRLHLVAAYASAIVAALLAQVATLQRVRSARALP